MNELEKLAPTLPGLRPDTEAKRLVEELVAFWPENGKPELRRAITVSDKRALEKRMKELNSLLRPTAEASEDRKRAAQAIAQMFTGFPSMRNADAQGLTAAYLAILEDQPIFAITAACKDVAQGKVEAIDPDWPPSSGRVHEQARQHAAAPLLELIRIKKTIDGEVQRRPLDKNEEKRVGIGLQKMSEDLKAADDARMEKLQADQAERQKRYNDAAILREYRRLGIEPIYADAERRVLVSPSLRAALAFTPEGKPR